MTLIQIESKPKSSAIEAPVGFHLIPGTELLFVVNGSRLYSSAGTESTSLATQVESLGGEPPSIDVPDEPVALSLNIAQTCNLTCRYCYADEGKFGGEMKLMPMEMALEAIRLHIGGAVQKRVSVGFIGVNRC